MSRIAKTCFFSSPKHRYYCCSRTVAGIGYLGFVETETIQPQNLSVIGHILDLLMNIYTAFAVHISIIPTLHIPLKRVSLLHKFLSVQLLRSQSSISAVRLFNLGGQGAQFATEYSMITVTAWETVFPPVRQELSLLKNERLCRMTKPL